VGPTDAASIRSLPPPENRIASHFTAKRPVSSLRKFCCVLVSVMCASSTPGRAQLTTAAERVSSICASRFDVRPGGIEPMENHESPCARRILSTRLNLGVPSAIQHPKRVDKRQPMVRHVLSALLSPG